MEASEWQNDILKLLTEKKSHLRILYSTKLFENEGEIKTFPD